MATVFATTTYTAFATVCNQKHELSITVRNIGNCDTEALEGMAAHTIATWARVYMAVIDNSWKIAPFAGKEWVSACKQKNVENEAGLEPHVTVWNKAWQNGIGITVHSWDNGNAALMAAASLMGGLDKLSELASKYQAIGIEKLEFAPFPSLKPTEPVKTAPQGKDKNDVDAWLKETSDNPPKTTQVKAFVRPAMKGSVDGLIQLEKGAKDKKTWQTGILANKPYDAKAVQYNEKELIAFPLTGAITVKVWPDGTRYFEVPSIGAAIKFREEGERVLANGSKIESDWQSLAQHLGVAEHVIETGASFPVSATHIVMSIGKAGTDSNGNPVQWKNYRGLYQLQAS